jgi:DNA polymerase-3 subunit epsilon
MKFIAIDFETANSERGSACQLGISTVENFKIVTSESYLIKPEPNYFDPFNSHLHGIDAHIVKDSPTFKELWPTINKHFDGTHIFAHNAGFDFSVLRNVLDQYNIVYPEFKYSCSYQIAKQAIPNLSSYRLDQVSSHLRIDLNHHDAMSDANACSEIIIHCLQNNSINSFDQISEVFKLRTGSFYPGGYNPSLKRFSSSNKISSIEFDASSANPESLIYDSTFVFTGTLESMVRKDAQKLVLECGGKCQHGVTRTTNYLVVGEQDFDRFGDGFLRSKTKKAKSLAESGVNIEVISERQFLEML